MGKQYCCIVTCLNSTGVYLRQSLIYDMQKISKKLYASFHLKSFYCFYIIARERFFVKQIKNYKTIFIICLKIHIICAVYILRYFN